MRVAKFEPTFLSPLREAFERYACKPLFSFLSCLFFFNFMVSESVAKLIRICKTCDRCHESLK